MNYAYCRASRLIQEVSCAVQEDMIRTYAERSIGESIDKVITDEDTSGRVFPFAERDGGGWLMHAVQPGDRVFFAKVDRLSRRTIDTLSVLKTFDKKGIKVHVVDFGGRSLDLEDPMSFALVSFMAVFAEVEGMKIAARTAEAHEFIGASGRPISQMIPPGMQRKHKRVGERKEQPYFVWNPKECAIVREIYERLESKTVSLQALARDFYSRDLRCPTAGYGWATLKRGTGSGAHWGDNRIRKAYRWYSCLLQLGLDIEIYPATDIAAVMWSWRKTVPFPKSLEVWAEVDPEGLKKAWEARKKLPY